MAKINEQDIEVLRERADIVEIISSFTQLKRAGAHTFKGLCPFHTEKTPSFTVDGARGLWHCFGCKEGGNLYQFVQKKESLPFPEAVEWVARRTGFELRYEEMRPGEQKARGEKARLVEANHAAAAFFHEQLMSSPDAAPARQYLESRGFGADVARGWMLGYAPGRNALSRHLLEKGFSPDELLRVDLARKSDRDGSLYDGFRDRIIFPTWDLNGDVVGFGARAMGDAQPKYLNTAETPLFSKSRLMYGLHRAKSAIARGAAVVVEGYTDVIALHEAGVTEAVATNGVALGENHFELLKKFSHRVILMLDSDDAGRGATERSFTTQHNLGLEVLVATLPAGHDPADVVRDDGVDVVRAAIAAAQPLMEFKLQQLVDKALLDTPEARARVVRESAGVLRWHPDPVARHEYAFLAARIIGVDPDVVHRVLGESERVVTSRGKAPDPERDRRLPGHVKVEREALQVLLVGGPEIAELADSLDPTDFTSGARRELFEAARSGSVSGSAQLAASATGTLSPDAVALFTELTVGTEEIDKEEARELAEEVFRRLRLFRLEREIKTRRQTLQEINPLVDSKRHDELFTELVGLEARRRDLLRQLQGAA